MNFMRCSSDPCPLSCTFAAGSNKVLQLSATHVAAPIACNLPHSMLLDCASNIVKAACATIIDVVFLKGVLKWRNASLNIVAIHALTSMCRTQSWETCPARKAVGCSGKQLASKMHRPGTSQSTPCSTTPSLASSLTTLAAWQTVGEEELLQPSLGLRFRV